MPIEFACTECGSVLRVPDGSSGKRSRCPACKNEQEIPFMVEDGQDAVASGKLSIPCPQCQHHLVCAPELLGTRGQCKKCRHIFTITTEPVVEQSAAPSLVFHCPECFQLFEGREEQRGRKGKCYVCQAVFQIKLEAAPSKAAEEPMREHSAPAPAPTTPARSTPTSSSQTAAARPPAPVAPAPVAPAPVAPAPVAPTPVVASSDEDELGLLEEVAPKVSQSRSSSATTRTSHQSIAKPKPTPTQPSGPIRFDCSECKGVMEVPGSTAGMETECPYCQALQTIPERSTAVTPTPTPTPAPIYPAASAPQAPVYDPFSSLDFPATNPYAAPTQTWTAPSAYSTSSGGGSSNAMTVGAVLSRGFETLFPSCLIAILHLFLLCLGIVALYGSIILMAYLLGRMGIPREAGVVFGIIAGILGLIVYVMLLAWFVGSISHMALRAVRKQPLDLGKALSPEGAFGAVLLMFGGYMGLVFISYIPTVIHLTTQALTGMEFIIGVWMIVMVPLIIFYLTVTSLSAFVGLDGESSSDAIQTSISMVLSNFGTMLAVKLIAWIIAILLSLPTLGLSYLVPLYMNAALYNAAKRNQ